MKYWSTWSVVIHRPHFLKKSLKKFQTKIVITNGQNMGLAERITDDTYLVKFAFVLAM